MWIDEEIFSECQETLSIQVWRPQKTLVVLGNANRAELECHIENCEEDQVEILKRCGGGGAVVLHTHCVVIGIGTWVHRLYDNGFYFQKINQAVIESLHETWQEASQIEQRGYSDLCIAQKKVAGTSLFRSRNFLLYQASLLIKKEIQLIERYLKHPSREPAYREGKSHRNFLTCLEDEWPKASVDSVLRTLKKHLPSHLNTQLRGEIIPPDLSQVNHILSKASGKSGERPL